MHHILFRFAALYLSAALLVFGGCLGKGTTQPTKFYVLNSLYSSPASTPAVANLPGIAIGVGPLRLPLHLDRPQIVTRSAQNQIQLAVFEQWGEPLQDNFTRVLAENLSILLATDNISIFPGLKPAQVDYQVTVDVTHFSGSTGGNVSLRARWRIYGENGKTEILGKFSNLSETATGRDIAAIVSAQSLTVVNLSREIAEAIKALSQGRAAGQ